MRAMPIRAGSRSRYGASRRRRTKALNRALARAWVAVTCATVSAIRRLLLARWVPRPASRHLVGRPGGASCEQSGFGTSVEHVLQFGVGLVHGGREVGP